MTPLHVAIYRGSPDVSKLLLDAGADPEIRDKVRDSSYVASGVFC